MNALPHFDAVDAFVLLHTRKTKPGQHPDEITIDSPVFLGWFYENDGEAGLGPIAEAFEAFCHDMCVTCAETGKLFLTDDCEQGFDGLWRHKDHAEEGLPSWDRNAPCDIEAFKRHREG